RRLMRRWWRRRSAGSSGCAWRGRTSRSTAGSANLITDFLNANPANLIKNRDHVAMSCHSLSANRNFNIWIRRVKLKEPRQDLIVLDILPIEADRVARAHAD